MPQHLPDWLTERSPFSGNARDFQELRAVLHARNNPLAPRVICFAGAGCSMPLLPGWGQLLGAMRDGIRKSTRLNEVRDGLDKLGAPESESATYLRFAEELRKIDVPEFYRSLRDHLIVPDDRQPFTRTHAAISCLHVDGVVTTNFDACLTHAQQRRYQLDVTLDGVLFDQPCYVGLDTHARHHIKTWLKPGLEFSFGGQTNAPLYLHGSLTSPRDVVFTASDYARFYQSEPETGDNTGLFFFKQLLGATTFLFIGYSFTDPFIQTVLKQVAQRPVWQGDHYALFGVGRSDDLDTQSKKLRKLRIKPVYYPITTPDHPDLQHLLDALESYDRDLVERMSPACSSPRPDGPPRRIISVVPVPPTTAPKPASDEQEWEKLPGTNSQTFVVRSIEKEILASLVKDRGVRIVGVVGLYGAGKSTFIRHVLDSPDLAKDRFPEGVVVHSVRDDAQADVVIDALYDRFPPASAIDPRDRVARTRYAADVLHSKRILLVLDGMELLQERPGQPDEGRFLSNDLRSLLLGHARKEGKALVVITSRFSLVEFRDHLGKSFREINLGGFSEGESISLLQEGGVAGDEQTLRDLHEEFDGHPLGLALFIGAITGEGSSAFAGGDVSKALDILRTQGGTSVDTRLATLLDWYRNALSPEQLAMLTLLAVYPASLSQVELRALLESGRVSVGGRPLTEWEGERALNALRQMRLIQFDIGQGRYECHAVVRHEMRRSDPDMARAAIASFTGGAPRVETIEELQRLVDAIEVAIESLGDFEQAHQLLTHLDSGRRFLDLGMPHIGVSCVGRFVAEDLWRDGRTRREAAEQVLGKTSIGTLVRTMRDLHESLGNLKEAERWRRIDGGLYLDLSAKSPFSPEVREYWLLGTDFASRMGDPEGFYGVLANSWEHYKELVRSKLDGGSLADDEDLLLLAMWFATSVGLRQDSGWIALADDVVKQAMRFRSSRIIDFALRALYHHLDVFTEDELQIPGGRLPVQRAPFGPTGLTDQVRRLKTALYRMAFRQMAFKQRASSHVARLKPDDLFSIVQSGFLASDATSADWLTCARALLAVAGLFEQARSRPKAAWARSWAASAFCHADQASDSFELVAQALEFCGEDLDERSRAIYFRGCANLALGQFAAALGDAETVLSIVPFDVRPSYTASHLALCWIAARELGDSRATYWKTEYLSFCARVYRIDEYNALRVPKLLPGEPGFQAAFPHLDLPDELLMAVPLPMASLEAIAANRFGDLLDQYRKNVLEPWRN